MYECWKVAKDSQYVPEVQLIRTYVSDGYIEECATNPSRSSLLPLSLNKLSLSDNDFPKLTAEVKTTADLLPLFEKVFGLHSFRPKQEEAINIVLDGNDCFVSIPTGGGKSFNLHFANNRQGWIKFGCISNLIPH